MYIKRRKNHHRNDPVLPPRTHHASHRVFALISRDSMVLNALIMIRKNLINCKLIREKKSGKLLLSEYMPHFRPEQETCPYCKCKGNCRIHGYYYRRLIDFVNGRPVVARVRILRVICSCGATHAILFDPVVPYGQHSLFFILRVLAEHFLHIRTIEKICEVFEISLPTFHRWKKLFASHRQDWQGSLASVETSLRRFLLDLVRKIPFSDFAGSFFNLTGISFLQSHKNPAPYRRRLKQADSVFQ